MPERHAAIKVFLADHSNGLQSLRAVRRLLPDIALVVFSIHSGPTLRLNYLGAGADCFLDKATEFRQLAGAIEYTSRSAQPAGVP